MDVKIHKDRSSEITVGLCLKSQVADENELNELCNAIVNASKMRL
jgi:hypothetical protein